jgi:hypothetical protein
MTFKNILNLLMYNMESMNTPTGLTLQLAQTRGQVHHTIDLIM